MNRNATALAYSRYGQAIGSGRQEFTDPADSAGPLLLGHGGPGPHLILKWNDMPSLPDVVDVVVHFHGYAPLNRLAREGITPANMDLRRHKEPVSGLDFSDPATGAAGRNTATLAILPRGHYFGGRSRAGYNFPALTGPINGLQRLIDFSLAWLRSQVSAPAAMGRLILTAHSGGGAALSLVLGLRSANESPAYNPDEVHLFDALYGGSAPVAAWANARIQAELAGGTPGALRVLFRRCEAGQTVETETHSRQVQRAISGSLSGATPAMQQRYRVEATTVSHNDMPGTYGWQLLADSGASLANSRVVPNSEGSACSVPRGQAYAGARARSLQITGDGPEVITQWDQLITDAQNALGSGHMPRITVRTCGDHAAMRGVYEQLNRTDEHDQQATLLRSLVDQILAWVVDINQSAIEQITESPGGAHFIGLNWDNYVFPGYSGDSSESTRLIECMNRLCPERRVPVLIRQLDVDNLVIPVSGQAGKRLFPDAASAFVDMSRAASAQGVTLTIGSAHRSAEEQARIAAANTNRRAAGGQRSAHRYGLATDLRLAVSGLSFRESKTRPMSNLIPMYRSPVYKWMYINAETFGFFPYGHEPWHWEYNPVGFPERFPTIVASLRAGN